MDSSSCANRDRLLAQHTPRTVAAADAKLHASAGDQIQRRKQARGYRDVARRWIRDAGAEPHVLRVRRHQRQHGIRFEPEDMRIEDPAIVKAGRFRLARECDDALHRHVGLDGDAEVACCLPTPRFVIPSEARDLQFAAGCGSLASLGMTIL